MHATQFRKSIIRSAVSLTTMMLPFAVGANGFVQADGGDEKFVIVEDGTAYWVHRFTTSGTTTLNVTEGGEVEFLIVGGGGGTAAYGTSGSLEDTPFSRPGGGGAGAVIPGTQTIAVATYTIKVGKGGTTGAYAGSGWGDGNPSEAFGVEAPGGGRGGGYLAAHDASTGPASGGGGGSTSNRVTLAGGGVVGLGHAGGDAFTNGVHWAGGGGGGAGGPGGHAYLDGGTIHGGAGGPGVAYDIDGTLRWYGGGGGGASKGGVPGPGGSGVGGSGDGNADNLNWGGLPSRTRAPASAAHATTTDTR